MLFKALFEVISQHMLTPYRVYISNCAYTPALKANSLYRFNHRYLVKKMGVNINEGPYIYIHKILMVAHKYNNLRAKISSPIKGDSDICSCHWLFNQCALHELLMDLSIVKTFGGTSFSLLQKSISMSTQIRFRLVLQSNPPTPLNSWWCFLSVM